MKVLLFLFLMAGPALRFDITDARGKKPSGITIDAGDREEDGWYRLTAVSKGKGESVLIWPFDGMAKASDGPGGVPVIVVQKGEARAALNPHVVALLTAGSLLGVNHDIGVDLKKATADLVSSDEPFAKGVGLLSAHKPADAVEPLGRALQERERQLTRVPSEIYPAAMLYGKALFSAGKFDNAAVAFLKAQHQRPSDPTAQTARAEALVKAGKAEAVK